MNNLDRWMTLAQHIATWSTDLHTKTGCVIVSKQGDLLSVGTNEFPNGVKDYGVPERFERPAKYLYTEHAERNAIYAATRNQVSLKKATMYLTWFPCADCTRAIIQTGITNLVCVLPDYTNPQWTDHFSASTKMLTEAYIAIHFYDEPGKTT